MLEPLLYIFVGFALASVVWFFYFKNKNSHLIDRSVVEEKENYIYYDNIINMVYALGEEKKNAESVRRMAFKAHFSRREYD